MPSPTERDKSETVMNYKIGMERLAYAIRATNPASKYRQNQIEIEKPSNSLNKKVLRHINNDKWGPPMGTKDAETEIKDLRNALFRK